MDRGVRFVGSKSTGVAISREGVTLKNSLVCVPAPHGVSFCRGESSSPSPGANGLSKHGERERAHDASGVPRCKHGYPR
mgnify:CR=1 FL=1